MPRPDIRTLLLAALLALAPGRGRSAEAEPAPSLFDPSTWADSSGSDGLGGVKVAFGKNASGNKILPLREDDCGREIDDESLAQHPTWVVFKDKQGKTSLSFEWTWVTQGEQKHWDKTWGGAGIAFNDSWTKLDARGARFLVAMVKASHKDPKWEVRLSLNSNAGGKDVNSGGLNVKAFADGRSIGPDWTRVVIPLDAFPNAAGIDLGSLSTLGVDLGGELLENQPCWVRFDNIYFTDTDLLTSPSRLGWLPQAGGVLLSWDLPASAKPERFVVSAAGKSVKVVDGSLRQALLPASLFQAGPVQLSVRAVRGAQVSPELAVTVALQAQQRGRAQVTVGSQARHRVSPLIFGNNNLKGGLVAGMHATVNRWGGNRKTRYNWKDDADSAAADWYFLNEAQSPAGAKDQDKSWYRFIKDSLDNKAQVNMVVPIIDWLAKRPPSSSGPHFCSFPLSLYPNQASNDGQGCGNGRLPDGTPIWGNDPAYNNVPNSPALQGDFVRTVVRDFGPASKGGVRFYSLDNEPGLWSDTHRDIKPKGVGYDELLQRSVAYASAIKAADPSAEVMGLVAWGVKELAGSNLDYYGQQPDSYKRPDKFGPGDQPYFDRKRHGDLPLVRWYLRQMRQAESKAGRRLIDYLDVHWYPETYGKDSQGATKRLSADLPYDPALAPQQFEALREFWDPSYRNQASWTANAENGPKFWDPFHPVIPALKALVQEDYPGTKLAITEYDTGSRSYYHGALLRAVALGIFMDQGLEAANNWYETGPDKYLYWAQRLFMDYDGQGGNVLGWSLPASSSDPDLYAFATARSDKVFVLLVNRNHDKALDASLDLPWPARGLRRFVITEPAGPGIVALPAQAAQGRRLSLEVPAWSIELAEATLEPR